MFFLQPKHTQMYIASSESCGLTLFVIESARAVAVDRREFLMLEPCRFAAEDQDVVGDDEQFEQHATRWKSASAAYDLSGKLNAVRALYSLSRAARLIRAQQRTTGRAYDLIVAARPDMSFLTPFPFALPAYPNSLRVMNGQHWGGVNDRFAAGDGASMLGCYMVQYERIVSAGFGESATNTERYVLGDHTQDRGGASFYGASIFGAALLLRTSCARCLPVAASSVACSPLVTSSSRRSPCAPSAHAPLVSTSRAISRRGMWTNRTPRGPNLLLRPQTPVFRYVDSPHKNVMRNYKQCALRTEKTGEMQSSEVQPSSVDRRDRAPLPDEYTDACVTIRSPRKVAALPATATARPTAVSLTGGESGGVIGGIAGFVKYLLASATGHHR